MAQLFGCDISQFQGSINWDTLNAASNFVMIRATYGTIPDVLFQHNKSEARRVRASAGPLGVGYYHYAYARLLDPIASADFFLDTIGPLQQGEILALDWEEPYGGDWVAWVLAWLTHVENRTGVKPLLYMNQSFMKARDWSPVINADFGLWLAAYGGSKDEALPPTPWPVVAMAQWTSSDIVPGIAGKVDGDTFYGDFNAFYRYGYAPPPAAPVSVPAAPAPEPAPPAPPPVAPPVDSVQPAPPLPTPLPPVTPPVPGPDVPPPSDPPVAPTVPVVDPLSGDPATKGVPIPVNYTIVDQTVSKAIAGGVVGMILTVATRYGFDVGPQSVTLLGVVVTAVIGYAVGHVVVYFAPRNANKQ